MSFFHTDDLTPRFRGDQNRIEPVGRAVGSLVVQIGASETVFLRNLVVDPSCEKVLGDGSLAGEAISGGITICVRFGGHWPEGEILLNRRIDWQLTLVRNRRCNATGW